MANVGRDCVLVSIEEEGEEEEEEQDEERIEKMKTERGKN